MITFPGKTDGLHDPFIRHRLCHCRQKPVYKSQQSVADHGAGSDHQKYKKKHHTQTVSYKNSCGKDQFRNCIYRAPDPRKSTCST